jgi:hypothetical protein
MPSQETEIGAQIGIAGRSGACEILRDTFRNLGAHCRGLKVR